MRFEFHQYAKNTLVFVPALTSHQVNLASLGSAFLAFMAFSACASSAYLLNDLFEHARYREPGDGRSRSRGWEWRSAPVEIGKAPDAHLRIRCVAGCDSAARSKRSLSR